MPIMADTQALDAVDPLERKYSNPVHDDKPLDADAGDEVYVFAPNAELEKRILRKIDLRLIPIAMIMYLLNYLDRNNVGNAKTAGMQKDLNLSSSDYSLAVSIFFVGYLCLQVPSNMILSRTRPRFYLPGIMFVWGCLVIGYVGVNTKAGLIGLRFVLGVVEAGFFPGILLYMSFWYKKMELARRFAVFYSASLLAGAFGGLLAGAILSGLNGASGLPAWKWLFLIEGLMTVCFSVIAVFILPDFPGNTKWLSKEERDYAVGRLIADNNIDSEEDTAIGHWKSIVMAVKDWRTWLFCFGQSCNTAAGTITYFIPTLMSALGYSGKHAQYMTVPIYMVALVIVLVTCFSSDITQERPKHIMAVAALSVVSLAITAGVQGNPHVRYAFLAFGASGIWACSPMTLTYLSNTISRPAEKRAVSVGIVNALANLSSVYGSYIWPSTSAPKYIPGFVTSTMLQFGSFAFAVAAWYLLKKYPYPVKALAVRMEATS
ncbi:major facilitator superfamily domain-containing protein [Naematelia encephala]|uniref:Major facilitator superfamily domain-containing protein n=1 Tax=Naematelia encephala TaxID=71784 RepID=A0A1Y2AUT2_9TREE|nr:major facilitator superfamily domain-containing protein [Naematelia encephala]